MHSVGGSPRHAPEIYRAPEFHRQLARIYSESMLHPTRKPCDAGFVSTICIVEMIIDLEIVSISLGHIDRARNLHINSRLT